MEKKEHKIHYAQYSHLETVPIVSQKSLCPFCVIQADVQSESELNVASEHQCYNRVDFFNSVLMWKKIKT